MANTQTAPTLKGFKVTEYCLYQCDQDPDVAVHLGLSEGGWRIQATTGFGLHPSGIWTIFSNKMMTFPSPEEALAFWLEHHEDRIEDVLGCYEGHTVRVAA